MAKKKVMPGSKGTTEKIRRWKVDRQSYLDWCEANAEIADLNTEIEDIAATQLARIRELNQEQQARLTEMRENAAVPEGVRVGLAGTHFVEQKE